MLSLKGLFSPYHVIKLFSSMNSDKIIYNQKKVHL